MYQDNEEHLKIIIMPTEKCNFRCVYCYENHEIRNEDSLNYQAILEFIKKQLKQCNYKELDIMWFGGEPMLKMSEIETFMHSVRELSNQYQIRLYSSITTNGYLITKHNFQVLLDNNITDFQITVDGDHHNQTRVLPDGSPTMQVILDNLKYMHKKEDNFSVIVRVNIDRTSGDNHQFYHDLYEAIGDDKRFNISVHNVFQDEGIQTKDIQYCKTNDLKEINENCAKENHLQVDTDQSVSPIDICYACCENAYAFRPDGTIVKCTVSLNEQWNQIGMKEKDCYIINSEKNKKLSKHVLKKECMFCNNITKCRNIICLKDRFVNNNCTFTRREK